MIFQSTTPDTTAYMIGGYAVIAGLLGFLLISMYTRWRNVQRDNALLEELKKEP